MEYNSPDIKKKAFFQAILSFLGFLLLWTIFVCLNKQYHFNDLIEGILGIGDLIFIGSGVLLIIFNRDKLSIKPREMFLTAPRIKILFPLIILFIIYYTISMFISHGGFYVNDQRNIPKLILMFSIVGFQEELLFRGWFLNIFSSVVSEKKANLISGLLFMLIHYPGWIIAAVPINSILYMSIGSFALGIIFGWSFGKTKSIWTPIILHMLWDVFSYLV